MTKKNIVIFSLVFINLVGLFLSDRYTYTQEVECPIARFIVKGIIKDKDTKVPIEQAKVYVFIDEYEFATSYVGENHIKKTRFRQQPDFSITSLEGEYEVVIYFDTHEKEIGAGTDVCTKRPQLIELVIIKEDYLTKRKEFTKNEFRTTETGFAKGRIEIPDIEILSVDNK